jgi:hypothetical protein
MRWAIASIISSAVLAAAVTVNAAEIAGPPDVGDFVPSYASTKCGGIDDGVAVGKTTCYTCRAGNEPIFYIFARQRNDAVVKLVKQIESIVAENREKQAAAVVNFLGDPKNDAIRNEVADFGQRHGFEQVALTVTTDEERFGLAPNDEVTVILFEKGIIRLRNSVASGALDNKTIESISRRSKALLK